MLLEKAHHSDDMAYRKCFLPDNLIESIERWNEDGARIRLTNGERYITIDSFDSVVKQMQKGEDREK